jgi:glycosyltransferase involved in cell wall biosynthesis
VFVSPSWAESFPYTVLEAMALGASIVATDVGGVGEAVLDRSTGLLVPPRDSAALAAAIVALLTDPRRAARLAAAARELVSRRFTVETMVAETASVYRELLERAPSRTARS